MKRASILLLILILSLSKASFAEAEDSIGDSVKENATPATSANAHQLTLAQPTLAQRLRREVHAALRSQATAGDQEQPAAVAELMRLRDRVSTDEVLSTRLRTQLATKLHNRLARLSGEIAKDVRKRQRRIAHLERRAKAHNAPHKIRTIEADKMILAQWRDVLGQFADDGGLGEGLGGGLGEGLDGGEQLVELIEQTICPDDWETNGGNNRIVYFANLRAIVVSATGN